MAEKEKFIEVTSKQIIAALASLIVLGAFSFVANTIFNKIDDAAILAASNEKKVIKMELLMDVELRESITSLTKELEKTNDKTTTFGNNQRSLERTVDRLEILMEGMEK